MKYLSFKLLPVKQPTDDDDTVNDNNEWSTKKSWLHETISAYNYQMRQNIDQ